MITHSLERICNFYNPPKSFSEIYKAGNEKPEDKWDESYHDEIKNEMQKYFRKENLNAIDIKNAIEMMSNNGHIKRWVLGNQFSLKELAGFSEAIQNMETQKIELLFMQLFDHKINITDRIIKTVDEINKILQVIDSRNKKNIRKLSYTIPSLILCYTFPERYPRIKYTELKYIANYLGLSIKTGINNIADWYELMYSLYREFEKYMKIRDYVDLFVMLNIACNIAGTGKSEKTKDEISTYTVKEIFNSTYNLLLGKGKIDNHTIIQKLRQESDKNEIEYYDEIFNEFKEWIKDNDF